MSAHTAPTLLPPSGKWALAALAVLALALIIPSTVYGLRAAWVDASTAGARNVVNGWREGYGQGFSAQLLQSTIATLEEGSRTDPDNAQLHIDLGYLYITQAIALEPHVSNNEQLRQHRLHLLDTALQHYHTVTQLRPRFPYGWGYLALALSQRGTSDDAMWDAFDKALALGHNEGGVQLSIVEVAFAHWKQLSPSRRASVDTLLQHTNAEVQKDIQRLAQRAGIALPARP